MNGYLNMSRQKILSMGVLLGMALTLPLSTTENGQTEKADPGVRFVNNRNGTISDLQTGLMWEVKDDSRGLHDKDRTYTWSSTAPDPDGTLFAQFLAEINSHDTAVNVQSKASLGGYTDWRIPTIAELQTLRDASCRTGPPCVIDPIFHTNCTPGCMSVAFDPAHACSCTGAIDYWSSTSFNPRQAWGVSFDNGSVITNKKTSVRYARAVRGGPRVVDAAIHPKKEALRPLPLAAQCR